MFPCHGQLLVRVANIAKLVSVFLFGFDAAALCFSMSQIERFDMKALGFSLVGAVLSLLYAKWSPFCLKLKEEDDKERKAEGQSRLKETSMPENTFCWSHTKDSRDKNNVTDKI